MCPFPFLFTFVEKKLLFRKLMDHKIGSGARCAMIGYGSWATALAKVLTENEPSIGWYVRNPEVLESLRNKGRNPRYLSNVRFDRTRINPSDDLDRVVSEADIVILASPSAYLKRRSKR